MTCRSIDHVHGLYGFDSGVAGQHMGLNPALPSRRTVDDLYRSELRNLWSAGLQMVMLLHLMAQWARDANLRQSLRSTIAAIDRHTEVLEALLFRAGVGAEISDSIGMRGLVHHAVDNLATGRSRNGLLLDISIIAQHERVAQYYLTVADTAGAYAKALGMNVPHSKLLGVISDIRDNHRYAVALDTMSHLAAVA